MKTKSQINRQNKKKPAQQIIS